MADRPITATMRRELKWIARWGEPGDLADYGVHALAFHARERVLSALLRRELIRDESGGFVLTNAGRAACGVAPTEKDQPGEACARAAPAEPIDCEMLIGLAEVFACTYKDWWNDRTPENDAAFRQARASLLHYASPVAAPADTTGMTLAQRCAAALQSLPDAPYRDMLARLLDDLRAVPVQPAEPVAWQPQFDAHSEEQERLVREFCFEIAGPRGKPGRNPDPVRLLEMAEALYNAERDDQAPLAFHVAPPVVAQSADPLFEFKHNLTKRIVQLESAIRQTLDENAHLADGENCTLITLKLALEPAGVKEPVAVRVREVFSTGPGRWRYFDFDPTMDLNRPNEEVEVLFASGMAPTPDDGVWEALQRLIENAQTLGLANQEDALVVARWRGRFIEARERASGVKTPDGEQHG